MELFYHLSVDQKHKYWIWQVLDGHKCYNFTISYWQESCTCIFNLPEVCNPLMILRLYDFFLHLFSINCMLPVQSDIAYKLDFCSSAMHLWHTAGLWFMKICIFLGISLKQNHWGHWTCTVIWTCMVVAWKVGRCFAM